jgi:hypothetical protein
MALFLWTQKQRIGPRPRFRHAMAYDFARGNVVLFGGGNDSSLLGDTWVWDGALWTEVADTGPEARAGHAMAFDVTRQKLVLFGGIAGGTLLGDTWEWDGAGWTQMAESGPSARSGHAMLFDSARGLTTLFGGKAAAGLASDTWGWDGNDWTQRQDVGPSPRQGHMMAYDPAKARGLLFGGAGADNNGLGDTWAWDGTNWTELQELGPGRCVNGAMIFANSSAVLFGGVDSIDPALPLASHKLNDNTWQLQSDRWTEVQDIGPSPRWHHAMAFDTKKSRIVLFGGLSLFVADGDPVVASALLGDTWDHADDSAPLPPAGGGGVVVLAGLSLNQTTMLNENGFPIVVTYTLSAPAPAAGAVLNTGVFVADGNALKPVSLAAISAPPTVTVPAGQATGTFKITRGTEPLALGTYTVAALPANDPNQTHSRVVNFNLVNLP